MEDIFKNKLYNQYLDKYIDLNVDYVNKQNIGLLSDYCPIALFSVYMEILENLEYFADIDVDNLVTILNSI